MAKKIIVGLVIFVLLIAVGLMAASWYVSSKAEDNLRMSLANTAQGFDAQFDNVNVNLFTSAVTIRGLRMFNRQSQTQLNFSAVTFDLPFSELTNVATAPRGGAINAIEAGNVRLQNVVMFNANAGVTVTAGQIFVGIDGNLGDIIRSMSLSRTPAFYQEIDIMIQDLNATRGDLLDLTRSLSRTNQVDRISGKLVFNPEVSTMTFESFRISNFEMNTDITGGITFSEAATRGERENMDINILLSTRVRGPMWTIASTDAGVNFRRMETKITGFLPSDADYETFITENNFRLEIEAEQFQFFPPRNFSRGPGRGLAVLGITPETLIIPKVNGVYRITNNQLIIDETSMDTPFASLNLSGRANLNRDNITESPWLNTGILIKPTTRENAQFITSLTGMLGVQVQRQGENMFIPMRGTLGSPTFMP